MITLSQQNLMRMVEVAPPGPSVSEYSARPPSEAPKLTDLPNEILVQVLCYLNARSVLHLRMVCRRLHTLTSDPVNWSAISWTAGNRIKDVDGLKLALRLSKGVLQCVSLFSYGRHFHLSKCIDRILSCRHLQSISLNKVVYTERQIIKLLSLPGLVYLHLDSVNAPFMESIAVNCRQLKTLSLSLNNFYGEHTDVWAEAGYIPPDLRIAQNCYHYTKLRIEIILSLPPSLSHSAYFSIYHLTTEEVVPPHPYLQFHFTPDPTLLLMRPLGLTLTANTPGSKDFSAAVYNHYCDGMNKSSIDVCDIYGTLTLLRLYRTNGLTPQLLGDMIGAFHNLIHLDISGCDEVLSDLRGLAAVNSSCPKLKVLSLSEIGKAESLEKLWRILAMMANLRVLYVPTTLIMEKSDPIPMPRLTAIKIDGPSQRARWHCNTEQILDFLAQIPSLEVFQFRHVPQVTVFRGFSSLLHASPNLTHLYISKRPGNKLTLPTDPSCYANLQQFYFDCTDFVFQEDLANAIAQSKNLRLLRLQISYVDINGIVCIVDTSKLLSVFHVCMYHSVWSIKRADLFSKSLRETAKKKEGRTIDFRIMVHKNTVNSYTGWNPDWFPY